MLRTHGAFVEWINDFSPGERDAWMADGLRRGQATLARDLALRAGLVPADLTKRWLFGHPISPLISEHSDYSRPV